MTVQDLIDILSKEDPDKLVVIRKPRLRVDEWRSPMRPGNTAVKADPDSGRLFGAEQDGIKWNAIYL